MKMEIQMMQDKTKRQFTQVDTSTNARMDNKRIKPNFVEPNATLDWAAYHLFDQLFYAKYCSGKLTMKDYLDLIEVSISHVTSLFVTEPVAWYQFRTTYRRQKRLNNLNELRNIIYHSQWRQKRKIGPFATIVGNISGHRFPLGTPVVVINVFQHSAYVKDKSVSQGEEVMLDDLKDDTN
jgi:hypothetical protein